MILVRVSAAHFVAGFIIKDGYVIETAPILKYLKGFTEEQAIANLNRRRLLYERFDYGSAEERKRPKSSHPKHA